MIFIGIVGAETPMAKAMLEQIAQNREEYSICFKVDASYKESKAEARYDNVDTALLMLPTSMVIDFTEDAVKAYENAKVYLDYHVPAILTTAGLDNETLDTLKHIRSARIIAPTLIVEPKLSVNQVLMLEQAEQIIKVLGRDVKQINLDFRYPAGHDFNIEPYMPLIARLNRALGISDWTPKTEACRNSRTYTQQFGFVQITLERSFGSERVIWDGLYDLQMIIRLKDSWIQLGEKSSLSDVWCGLDMLAEYAVTNKEVERGEIYTNLLPYLVHRRMREI
jgi:hypothetical protein